MGFCELIGESRPIPLFCHRVTSGYDKGKTIYAQWEEIYPWETAKEVAKRLYLIEHKVQIHALYLLATGQVKESNAVSIPTSYYEEELLKQAIEDSLEKYPLLKTRTPPPRIEPFNIQQNNKHNNRHLMSN